MDDIHPNMNHDRFNTFCQLLDKYNIKPILGVIPNNLDESLNSSLKDIDFFSKIKALQDNEYIISLHGYEHKYINKNAGIMNINNYSEFAGLNFKEQENKIDKALEIFQTHNIKTNMFMAPAHSFDKVTIEILKKYEINMITDGFYLYPYFKNGIWWIPQQFWAYRNVKFSGIFTFCFHIDTFSDDEFEKFILVSEEFFGKNKENFIKIDDIELDSYKSLKYKTINILFNILYRFLYKLKHDK
jgi:predicted deacetylase